MTQRYEVPVVATAADFPMFLSEQDERALVRRQARLIADWVDNEVLCDLLEKQRPAN